MLGWKIGSEGVSSVPPDSFLIGPLKGHSSLPVTFPPKQIVVAQSVVMFDGAYEILCTCIVSA